MNKADIQRAHRLGKRRRNGKSRPVIVRFQSFKKRNEFRRGRSNLKNTDKSFIAGDLTPIRAKLLRYMKFDCDDKLTQIHTINGNIRFKKSAIKEKLPPADQGRDPGIGNWLSISSPDDLFKLGLEIDFS